MFLRETVNHANIAKHNRNGLKTGKIVHFFITVIIFQSVKFEIENFMSFSLFKTIQKRHFLRETENHANIAKHNPNGLKIGKIVHFYHSYHISKRQI